MYNYNQQQYPPYNYQQTSPGPPPPQWQAPSRRGWGDPRTQSIGGSASPAPQSPGFNQNTYGSLPGPPPPPPPPPPPSSSQPLPPTSHLGHHGTSAQPHNTSQWGVKYNQGPQYSPAEQAPPLPPRPMTSAAHHDQRPQDSAYNNTAWQQASSPQVGSAVPQQPPYYQHDPQNQWTQTYQQSTDPNVPPMPPPRPPEYQGQPAQQTQVQHGHLEYQRPPQSFAADPYIHDPYSHHKPSHYYEPSQIPGEAPQMNWADQPPQRPPTSRPESRMAASSVPTVSVGQHDQDYTHLDAVPISPVEPDIDHRLQASALGAGGNPSDWEHYAFEPEDSKPARAPSPHVELPAGSPVQQQFSHSPRQSLGNIATPIQEKTQPVEPTRIARSQTFQEARPSVTGSPVSQGHAAQHQDSPSSDTPDLGRAGTIDSVIDAWSTPLRVDKSNQEARRASLTANRHTIAFSPEEAARAVESSKDRNASIDMNNQPQPVVITKVEDPYADLEPEYRASLKRYANMLRREAAANEDEERYKIFETFVTKELRMRSILYGVEMPQLISKQEYEQLHERAQPAPGPQPPVVPYEVVKAAEPTPAPAPPPPPAFDQLVQRAQLPEPSYKDGPSTAGSSTALQQLSTTVQPPAIHRSQTPDIPMLTQSAFHNITTPAMQNQPSASNFIPYYSGVDRDITKAVSSKDDSNSVNFQHGTSGPTGFVASPQFPPVNNEFSRSITSIPTSLPTMNPVIPAGPINTSTTIKEAPQPPRPITPPRLMTDVTKTAESPKSRDDFVVINANNEDENDVQYSPGGRPRLPKPQRTNTGSHFNTPVQNRQAIIDQGPPSPGANAPIVIEDYVTVRAASPPRDMPVVISHPKGDVTPIVFQPPRPLYTPFRYAEGDQPVQTPVAPSNKPADEAYSNLRKEAIDSNRLLAIDAPPRATTPTSGRQEHEEAFIGLIRSQSKLVRKKDPSISGLDLLRVGTPAARGESVLKKTVAGLRSVLPTTITSVGQPENAKITAMKKKLEQMPDQFGFIHDNVVGWDRANRDVRRKLDDERRIRQEDSEAHIDGLFHDNEIGYADIGVMEEEFKLAEAEQKYREDQDELESFVIKVYTPITARLEKDIAEITTQYTLAIDMLDLESDPLSRCLTNTTERVSMTSIMETVLQIYNKLDLRYQKVAEAHYERERRRKRVELTVLYTNGDTAGVKKLENEFNVAEKMQILQDARNRDTRANRLMDLFDRAIARGLGDNQTFIDDILARTKTLNDILQKNKDQIPIAELFTPDGPRETLSLTQSLSDVIMSDSRQLITISNTAEKLLNDADYSVSVAEARVAVADEKTYSKLESEKAKEDAKIVEEIDSRISSVSKGPEELSALVREMIGRIGDDPDHKERIKKSLEAARMRNAGKEGGTNPNGTGNMSTVPE